MSEINNFNEHIIMLDNHRPSEIKYAEFRYMKVDCACGGKYLQSNYWNHLETKKHKAFLETGLSYKRNCEFDDNEKRKEYYRNYMKEYYTKHKQLHDKESKSEDSKPQS